MSGVANSTHVKWPFRIHNGCDFAEPQLPERRWAFECEFPVAHSFCAARAESCRSKSDDRMRRNICLELLIYDLTDFQHVWILSLK